MFEIVLTLWWGTPELEQQHTAGQFETYLGCIKETYPLDEVSNRFPEQVSDNIQQVLSSGGLVNLECKKVEARIS